MKKVLITFPLGKTKLQQINQYISADCVPGIKDSYTETSEMIADYDGLLATGIKKVDKALMDKAPNLKIISKYGVGYDDIDIAYAKEKNILVANTPNSVTAPTADLAAGLLLSLSLQISVTDRAIRNKNLKGWYSPALPSIASNNKILGIIGMGRIGKAVAKRMLPFGMKIVYYQRTPLPKAVEEAYQATYLSLENLLQQADIVSLHTPLNATTRHLIGAPQLALMKPSALIVNTARGSVIDEVALITALENKQIAGAALDVFANEPTIPDAFLKMDNVVLTPHIGTGSGEARQEMFNECVGNLVEYFSGATVKNRVV